MMRGDANFDGSCGAVLVARHHLDEARKAVTSAAAWLQKRTVQREVQRDLLMHQVRARLGRHLLKAKDRAKAPRGAPKSWGLCYTACEALWWALGGPASAWRPKRVKIVSGAPADYPWENHWILLNDEKEGRGTLDPTADQFGYSTMTYTHPVGCGFLTRTPSKRAREILDDLGVDYPTE